MEPTTGILLVDDEPRNLDALEAVLEDSSYRLIRATSGNEALRVLLRDDVAVIVLDIHMPEINGFEVARLIKGANKFRQIPILFLTAHMMEDRDVIAGYGAGGVDYLTKPVNPEILRHKVAVFADLFRKTRALAELNETLEARVRQRTAELERSEAALRAAAQQKDEFLATLAHELRNPLAPLRMGLDLLMAKSNDNRRTLSAMNRQLDHMVRLIDDLLDVARISSGKLQLKKEQVNVASCIQTAIETCRPFLEQRKQRLASELDSTLFALADPTRLAQIVANLLHNACKFTPEGGQVKLSLAFEGGRALIRVQDEGVGIAPDQLSRVFDMFTSVEGPKPVPQAGLGIGLALSRKLAQMHDAELTAESPGLGRGSVFTLALQAERREAAGRPSTIRPPGNAEHGRGIHVLIIEDNQDSAEVLASWLESRGYATTVAHDGAQGLALVKLTHPQIVLCDIGLPELTGDEVCRQVRQLELGYRPAMVALTGWGTQEDRAKTQAAGFDHHLVKPVAPETLFTVLDSLDATAPQ
jgi:signal transduction histidine kinase